MLSVGMKSMGLGVQVVWVIVSFERDGRNGLKAFEVWELGPGYKS